MKYLKVPLDLCKPILKFYQLKVKLHQNPVVSLWQIIHNLVTILSLFLKDLQFYFEQPDSPTGLQFSAFFEATLASKI